MTINPAAGPLIVRVELLTHVAISPPATALQMPAIGGNPLAFAMARQSGMAMRNTRKPAMASNRKLPNRPGFKGGGGADVTDVTAMCKPQYE
jgi:hypothetical protein